jgi:hypothetical protein
VVPPVAPVLNSAKLNGNDVELQWGMVVSDAIMGYDVYRVYGDKKEKLTQILAKENRLPTRLLRKKEFTNIMCRRSIQRNSNQTIKQNVREYGAGQGNSVCKVGAYARRKDQKVQVELLGVMPDEVQIARLFRKDGDTGFKVLPYQFSALPTIDETSEPETSMNIL